MPHCYGTAAVLPSGSRPPGLPLNFAAVLPPLMFPERSPRLGRHDPHRLTRRVPLICLILLICQKIPPVAYSYIYI